MIQRILLVEDEEAIAIALQDRLVRAGYEVEVATDGIAAFNRASNSHFHLILLDLLLPGKSGIDVCRDLRQLGILTPILMLTAFGETGDKVLGLKIGADDYLTKPFEQAELLARVEALLRRSSATPSSVLQFGNLRLDLRAAKLLRDGQDIPLSAREFQLFRYFAERPGQLIGRDELQREVWGYGPGISTRTVDVHIGWLRQKLESDPKQPQLFVTRIGLGYQFHPPL